MIYRIGHQADKAGRKVLEKRAGGGGNGRVEITVDDLLETRW